jgi:hypothetical protein
MAVTFNGESTILKYLFICVFTDGTRIEQDEKDASKLMEGKSQFYDVLQAVEQGKKIQYFMLVGNGHVYTVDLLDGHFEINGLPFKTHEENHFTDYRIIYFRRHFHDATNEGFTNHRIEYHLGWQTTFQGKNYKRFIVIK